MKSQELKRGQHIFEPLPTTCLEHGHQEPCFECFERDEATSLWLDYKIRHRDRMDEYCETYDIDDCNILDKQDSEQDNDED